MIRVVLADDQQLVRSGFRALLDAEDDIVVVGEAGDGAEAVALAVEHRPDIVLMDIRMPSIDGLTAARQIAEHPDLAAVKVLVLTTFELDEYVYEALRAGASGFLVKHTEPAELVRAVRVVAAGEALLSPGVTRRLIEAFTTTAADSGEPDRQVAELLTAREREAVGLVAEGLSNEEIAERWVVSNATVRTHVSRAMTKLNARDRAQLVVFAYRTGLASIPMRRRDD
jgi:DNA-binding NarL/FixJ family response regulator